MNESPPIETEVVQANPSQALTVRHSQDVAPVGLFGTHEPVAIIEKATNVATALKAVISKQGLISRISGKEYPKCEAWTLLGTMLGVFPVLCWSRPVDGGWEARVEARTRDGAIVGAAEAECLRSENNWKNRDEFALRSMAQTRATAKCLRMPLGFVMTLAGYEATPAEEMVADHPRKEPNVPASPPASVPAPAASPGEKGCPQPQPAPGNALPVPYPTAESRKKMIDALKANPGQDNRNIVHEYFRKLTNPTPLMPNEEIEKLELRFVPATTKQMEKLAECVRNFESGLPAEHAFPMHFDPQAPTPGVTTPAQVAPKVVAEATKKPADPLWWRNVIVSKPRKGMKKAEYERHPDTLGALYDLRHGNDEEAQAARQRLWGLAEHAPEPRQFNGRTYQPTEADWTTYRAAQAFKEWFAANHPDEKL